MYGKVNVKLYYFDYEREAHFDKDDRGNEIEVSKLTATSETRIIVDNKNTTKGMIETVAKKLSFEDYQHCLRILLLKHVDINQDPNWQFKTYTKF